MTGQEILRTLCTERAKPRGDEALTHVSDLTTCLRAVAYRRRGVVPEPYDAATLAKFAIGHAYEQNVAKTLREAGHAVDEGVEVSAFGLNVGHPDLIVDGEVLVETKTTDGGAYYPKSDKERAGEPKEVSAHHAIQASAYALALGIRRAVVLVKHAGFAHDEIAHDVDPERYRAKIESLAADVVALTDPASPLPPAEPKPRDVVPYDECAYCRFRVCERNPAYDPAANEVEFA